MSPSSRRQPAGVPSGGEFAEVQRHEPKAPKAATFPPYGAPATVPVGDGAVAATWQGGIDGIRFLSTEGGTTIRFTPAFMGRTVIEVWDGPRASPVPSVVINDTEDPYEAVGGLLEAAAGKRAVKSVFGKPSHFVTKAIGRESTDGRLERVSIWFDGPEQYLRDDDGVEVEYDFASGQMTSSSPGPDPHDGAIVVAEKTGLSPQQSFEALHRALINDPESGITG